ncbi:MAG: hypothetical protein ACRDUX_20805 [Mycobacterium sp.]
MSYREFLPIPPPETATDPIASPADLHQRWRALMGTLGFGERLLWFAFIGPDRRLIKVASHVPVAASPEPALVENVMTALKVLVANVGEGSTVALLLSRPGVGDVTDADRQWATALEDAANRFGVPIEPIFRANDEAIVLVSRRANAA